MNHEARQGRAASRGEGRRRRDDSRPRQDGPREDQPREEEQPRDGAIKQRLITGVQPVREALKAHGARVSEVWVQAEIPRLAGLVRLAEDSGSAVKLVARSELDRAARGAQHQGVLAWGPRFELQNWGRLLETDMTLALALDRIVDPQNFGAIVRSAVGLARAPILWPEAASAPLSPATFRASAGAIEHAQLCRVRSLPEALFAAQEKGFGVVGLDGHATTTLTDVDLSVPTVIVLGSEGEGLGRAVRKACTATARLSQDAVVDSLNASVAVALAIYEAQRQRAGHR
ncbi:MAG TPA: RNA methyltransferase [Polyangiaceae bacterium]|nr:RNA methyltransferase [Polyangiaceae bacterium]